MADIRESQSRLNRSPGQLFLFSLGCAVGGVVRFLLGSMLPLMAYGAVSTSLFINTAGCFFLGALAESRLDATRDINPQSAPHRLSIVSGFCSGFTTIAGVTPQSIALFDAGNQTGAALYAIGNLILAKLCLGFGKSAYQWLSRPRNTADS